VLSSGPQLPGLYGQNKGPVGKGKDETIRKAFKPFLNEPTITNFAAQPCSWPALYPTTLVCAAKQAGISDEAWLLFGTKAIPDRVDTEKKAAKSLWCTSWKPNLTVTFDLAKSVQWSWTRQILISERLFMVICYCKCYMTESAELYWSIWTNGHMVQKNKRL